MAGGGEHPAHGGMQTVAEDQVRQRCVLSELGWDPSLCLHRPSLEGAGTSGSPWPPAPVGEDAWLCVGFAPQPGIWDPEEEKGKGGLAADLGNAKGSYAPKAGILPRPQGTETQPPKNEQGGNWADLVCLALATFGTQMQKGNCSQTAEVSLWFEREDRLGRRMGWPALFSSPFAVNQEVSSSLP